MSEPFDPHAAPPPNFPPPGTQDAPVGAPQAGAPAYGAPPPAGGPEEYNVPAFGAPPPTGGAGLDASPHTDMPTGVLAGFGSRLGATLLDSVFTSLISLITIVPVGFLVLNRWETEIEPCTVDGKAATCDVATDASIKLLFGAVGIWLLLAFIITVAYHVRPIARSGQTPGRKILGIKVVSTHTGQPPTLGVSFLYWLASIVGAIPCSLGWLWMLWDANNQTWHDKVCATVVVRA